MGAGCTRHFAQTQIEPFRQHDVQQSDFVPAGRAGVQVGEGLGEPGGVIHLHQDVRDPRLRQPPVEIKNEITGFLWNIRLKTFDAQSAVLNDAAGERAGARGNR